MAKDKTKVSIVILTLNNNKLLEEEFNLFKKLDTSGLDIELIVVNNGSVDATDELLKKTWLSI